MMGFLFLIGVFALALQYANLRQKKEELQWWIDYNKRKNKND